MKITLKNLVPGQEVALMNCVETGKIVERVGKGLYKVAWKGHTITTHRNQIYTKVHGRWTAMANAAD